MNLKIFRFPETRSLYSIATPNTKITNRRVFTLKPFLCRQIFLSSRTFVLLFSCAGVVLLSPSGQTTLIAGVSGQPNSEPTYRTTNFNSG